MPDPNDLSNSTYSQTPESEAPARAPSLRETIESSYDEVIEDAEGPEPSGQSDRARDNYGRFVAKDRDDPGEAEPKVPSPETKIDETQTQVPEPAPVEDKGTQLPQHWSAELKASVAKFPPELQSEFLNRHREMEADYTRKSQASAGAVSFTEALAPVFGDPTIQGLLQQSGMNAVQAIHEWGGFFKRASSPEPRARVEVLVEMAQRMGFDPARLFATGNRQPEFQLSDEDLNDPAIRYFADNQGRLTNELQEVRAALQQMREAEASTRQNQVVEGHKWSINQFGDAKDAQGNLLHPHFDTVMPQLHELFRIDPGRDLAEAYEMACGMNAEVRARILDTERQRLFGRNSAERARAAMRGNTRGITSPVAKPNASTNGTGGLRGVLEASADEVGF